MYGLKKEKNDSTWINTMGTNSVYLNGVKEKTKQN